VGPEVDRIAVGSSVVMEVGLRVGPSDVVGSVVGNKVGSREEEKVGSIVVTVVGPIEIVGSKDGVKVVGVVVVGIGVG